MFEVVRWLPSGDAKYWTGSSFSHNPFNAESLTFESAQLVREELVGQGYSPEDIEVVPA